MQLLLETLGKELAPKSAQSANKPGTLLTEEAEVAFASLVDASEQSIDGAATIDVTELIPKKAGMTDLISGKSQNPDATEDAIALKIQANIEPVSTDKGETKPAVLSDVIPSQTPGGTFPTSVNPIEGKGLTETALQQSLTASTAKSDSPSKATQAIPSGDALVASSEKSARVSPEPGAKIPPVSASEPSVRPGVAPEKVGLGAEGRDIVLEDGKEPRKPETAIARASVATSDTNQTFVPPERAAKISLKNQSSVAEGRNANGPALATGSPAAPAQVQTATNETADVAPAAQLLAREALPAKPANAQKTDLRHHRTANRDVSPDITLAQAAGSAEAQDPAQNIQVTLIKPDAFAKEQGFGRESSQAQLDPVTQLAPSESNDTKKSADAQTVKLEPSARPVISQLVHVARAALDGMVEVKLSPEELGRVRMTMLGGELGMTVQVTAERPETLDLIRRNIDMLAADLAEQGFQDLSFSFGDESSGDDQRSMSDESGEDQSKFLHLDNAGAVSGALPVSDGQLDIRL